MFREGESVEDFALQMNGKVDTLATERDCGGTQGGEEDSLLCSASLEANHARNFDIVGCTTPHHR
jgi:hypothetical protein